MKPSPDAMHADIQRHLATLPEDEGACEEETKNRLKETGKHKIADTMQCSGVYSQFVRKPFRNAVLNGSEKDMKCLK